MGSIGLVIQFKRSIFNSRLCIGLITLISSLFWDTPRATVKLDILPNEIQSCYKRFQLILVKCIKISVAF